MFFWYYCKFRLLFKTGNNWNDDDPSLLFPNRYNLILIYRKLSTKKAAGRKRGCFMQSFHSLWLFFVLSLWFEVINKVRGIYDKISVEEKSGRFKSGRDWVVNIYQLGQKRRREREIVALHSNQSRCYRVEKCSTLISILSRL